MMNFLKVMNRVAMTWWREEATRTATTNIWIDAFARATYPQEQEEEEDAFSASANAIEDAFGNESASPIDQN